MLKVFLPLLLCCTAAEAQIDMAFRRANATALYEFSETSGNIVRDSSALGSPLDLVISDPSPTAIIRGTGFIDIQTRNLISSAGPATKIINACKASGEMSIEAWVENNEPSQLSVGEYPDNTAQPNRIVTLSSGLLKNNFSIGQFYKDAELYYSSVNTSGNENPLTPGGSLNNPIISTKNQIIVPALETNLPAASAMQKIILTVSKEQVARLYLSDRDGNISRAAMTTNGFSKDPAASYFSDWYPDAKLTLGNLSTTIETVKNATGDFTKCIDNRSIANDPNCAVNSRYWKGKIYLVAIYCKALTDENIVGARANAQIANKIIPIDINVKVTANLKKAQDIFQRLTGVKTPLYDPALLAMENRILQDDPVGAAAIATNDPRFYNITVRDFASKMSNRPETITVPLNDFTATIIGAVRDEINSQRLLWDNISYMADATKASVPSSPVADLLRSNNHYESIDSQRLDLQKVLVQTTQKVFDGSKVLDLPTPAGLLTSRQWIASHAVAGTNRRLIEFSFREFLCTPLEQVADSTGPDNVVARDIDRFPGGSHTKFTTSCRACHTVMDGFRPAYSYFTFNNDYVMHSFTSPSVQTQAEEDNGLGMRKSTEAGATYVHSKLNQNATVFPGGRITADDSWVNNANYGANLPYFNWKRMSGKGVQEFGKMLSESKQFPICMANRVYSSVCKRAPTAAEEPMLTAVANEFSTTRNYNLKFLFQKIITTKECLGGN